MCTLSVSNVIYHKFSHGALSTGWRPVVAVFYYITIACNRNIVSRDSMILINKLGVTVGILLITLWNRL